jgi:hypothetical protein
MSSGAPEGGRVRPPRWAGVRDDEGLIRTAEGDGIRPAFGKGEMPYLRRSLSGRLGRTARFEVSLPGAVEPALVEGRWFERSA